jgi:hypothetical protein
MNGYEVVRSTDIGDSDKDLIKVSETLEVELPRLPEEGRDLKLEEIIREIDRIEEESTSRLRKLIEKKEILLSQRILSQRIETPQGWSSAG